MKKYLQNKLKQLFCKHNYIEMKRAEGMFFNSKVIGIRLECPKCEKYKIECEFLD